ncbi:MAG: hypothetical protein KIS96_07575 [Bauldia sp.]|nr:hypothetical protein [Bauldia sp.]
MERSLRCLGVSCILVAALLGGTASGQEYEGDFEPGVLPIQNRPFDLTLEVTTGLNGEPVLSRNEFLLARGGYYRLNFVCVDVEGPAGTFRLEATRLLEDSHIRLLAVPVGSEQIEFWMQGMSFRAIECDIAGTASFSFHPLRGGVYDIIVVDKSDPPQEARARVIVE